MTSFNQARQQILAEWVQLNNQWNSIAGKWQDKGKLNFQRSFWDSYEPTIRDFLGQLDQLERTCEQARREIE